MPGRQSFRNREQERLDKLEDSVPVALDRGFFSLVEQTIDLPLYSLAGHGDGILSQQPESDCVQKDHRAAHGLFGFRPSSICDGPIICCSPAFPCRRGRTSNQPPPLDWNPLILEHMFIGTGRYHARYRNLLRHGHRVLSGANKQPRIHFQGKEAVTANHWSSLRERRLMQCSRG